MHLFQLIRRNVASPLLRRGARSRQSCSPDGTHRYSMRRLVCNWTIALPFGIALFAAVPNSELAAQERGRLRNVQSQPESSRGYDVTQTQERTIRLNYFSAPWSKVLNDVAQKSGSTLVMHDVPPGKFSRHDWGKHNRQDAVNILNRELEPLGFRILAKDQFLTVMQSRRTRPEYQRPIAPQAPETVTRPVTPPASAQPIGQWVDQASVEQSVAPRRRSPSDLDAPHPFDSRRPGFARRQGISLTSQPGNVQRAGYEPDVPEADADIGSTSVSPQHRSAVEIAKQIHRAFGDRSKIENAGPNGLPAFAVAPADANAAAGDVQFTIEIDTHENQLHITADRGVRTGLKALIQQIDVNPLQDTPVPTLVAGDGNTAELGRRLQRPISTISRARMRTGASEPAPQNARRLLEDPARQFAQADQVSPQAPLGERAADPANMPAGEGFGVAPDIVGNLKGDVTIEALDDLDLLIIRGNTADVDAVMQVIQRIEEMALGSLPEITLHKLEHVDSQSLATLLNEVYDQLSELRSENAQQSAASVNVVPVVTPNAILILAPKNSMESVLDLVIKLDEPVDPTHELEVFRLQHAIASSVVTLLQEFFGDEPEGLSTRFSVAADNRTNSVIVQARPRDLSQIEEVIRKIDADEAGSVNQMKLFKLKNALADELAEFLNSAIQSVSNPQASTVGQTQNFQGQQNQTDPKSVILEFLAEDGQQLARSGLLDDIRFNAEPRTNSLAVTAPAQSLPLIEELIRILDRPSSAVADVKYFPLTNADAIDAVELLNELFTVEDNQNDDDAGIGVQLAGATDTSSSLLPLRFVADARTNSVIATGGADALIIVENLLYRLDQSNPKNRIPQIIKLRNSYAPDVADAINTFLQSQRELATIDPDRVSTSQLLEQEVIVTPEPISNSLIISATPQYLEQIQSLVNELDAAPSQVIIQALLVEVELDNTDEFGVEIGIQDPLLFDRSVVEMVETITTTTTAPNGTQTTTENILSQSTTPGFPFNNLPLGNNSAANPSSVGSQGLSNFSLGRTNNDLGYGGLVLSASSESVNVLIRALAARRNVRILSRPQIRTLDNQLAQIQVGQIVPVTDGITQTQTTVSPQIVRDPAGIILTVTPRISPEGEIVMEVVAEKSVYTDEGVPVFSDVNTGTVITAPIKNISTAQTTVKVTDGQTIVLGGMITDAEDVSERKVPWLGDLPIIGPAFRYDTHITERTELLIFLTPRVIHNDAVAEHIKQVEANRIHFFQEQAEEIHGPLFGVPGAMEFESMGSETYPPAGELRYLEGVEIESSPTKVIVPRPEPANPGLSTPPPPREDLSTSSRDAMRLRNSR